MEILAPVNANTLDAALDAGADAVYFGLKKLNARRGAKNFCQEDLPGVVQKIHAKGAKAHLTLNIDLSARETGLAARTLAFAQECGVDAVIVRDPAVLALQSYFPRLEFHLSTQSGVSSSAGVRMARELGCDRVVLARELTRQEIAACCGIDGIAIEVFGQGALCFCSSGRCLLSSWVGGRSGNRGACASPCRVGWKSTAPESREAHPLSMKDLCLVEELPALSKLGVASMKIEGRLKSASWVGQAVDLYRRAHDAKADLSVLRQEANELGGYTGRTLTKAYYDAEFNDLTDGLQGRAKSLKAQFCAGCCSSPEDAEEAPCLDVNVAKDAQGGTEFACTFGNATNSFRIPFQRIPNPRRAVKLCQILDSLLGRLPQEAATEFHCPDDLGETLLPRRCEDTILQNISDFLRQATKEDDGNIRITLPEEVVSAQTIGERSTLNRRTLGTPPNLVRFSLRQAKLLADHWRDFCCEKCRVVLTVTAKDTPADIRKAIDSFPTEHRQEVILAFPAVCYEEELPALKALFDFAAENDLLVEVNSWDTLQLAHDAAVGFVTGQGLAVLNPLAVRMLASLGAQWCAVSCEIDQEQLEDLVSLSEFPLSVQVYGRPALMVTRTKLSEAFAPAQNGAPGIPFQDARKTILTARNEGALTALRPETPFDWRGIKSAKVTAAYLEADYSGEISPLSALTQSKVPFLFNYDRQLR